MAPSLSKLSKVKALILNLISSVVALFHSTLVLVVADLMKFIFLMMIRIMIPNLDKYLLKNLCIQVTMIP